MQLVFHFGTENRADQLKKPPCMERLYDLLIHIKGFDLKEVIRIVSNCPNTAMTTLMKNALVLDLDYGSKHFIFTRPTPAFGRQG